MQVGIEEAVAVQSETAASSRPACDNRKLSIRLAEDASDLVAVQRLRAKVFFEEMGAGCSLRASTLLDSDLYDDLCDHLLVIDEGRTEDDRVVGTYRLLRESVARRHSGFYSADEFDLGPIAADADLASGQLLELGRSCVLPPYRTSATISLLWRGIAEYIQQHAIRLMFGCASFPGTNPDVHAEALSFLYHNHLADAGQRPRVLEGKGVPLERLKRGEYDERRAVLKLPPLLKGYLRAGAKFGDGAFIDHDFNTVDVCVVLPVDHISDRYASRFRVAA